MAPGEINQDKLILGGIRILQSITIIFMPIHVGIKVINGKFSSRSLSNGLHSVRNDEQSKFSGSQLDSTTVVNY